MAVVISEFEVVPPPAPSGDAEKDKPAEKDDKPKLDKAEVLHLLRKHAERAARVRSH